MTAKEQLLEHMESAERAEASLAQTHAQMGGELDEMKRLAAETELSIRKLEKIVAVDEAETEAEARPAREELQRARKALEKHRAATAAAAAAEAERAERDAAGGAELAAAHEERLASERRAAAARARTGGGVAGGAPDRGGGGGRVDVDQRAETRAGGAGGAAGGARPRARALRLHAAAARARPPRASRCGARWRRAPRSAAASATAPPVA